MEKVSKIAVELKGIRPLMFDRYAGDNNTQLPVQEKMYLDARQCLMMPSVNIYSLLCAINTDSVCKKFFGTAGKTIGLGIKSYTTITPYDIPIMDDNGPVKFTGFNEQIYTHHIVARLKNGIPNPKERPALALPWWIEFEVEYVENKQCTLENLRQVMSMGGVIGLGTFRPFFGRYEMVKFDVL